MPNRFPVKTEQSQGQRIMGHVPTTRDIHPYNKR